jgi:PucR C-terminal helix-turn-helix domain/GGDEF-like domain
MGVSCSACRPTPRSSEHWLTNGRGPPWCRFQGPAAAGNPLAWMDPPYETVVPDVKGQSVVGSWIRLLQPDPNRRIESALHADHRQSAVEQVGEDPVCWATQVAYDTAAKVAHEMSGFGDDEAAIKTMQKGTESAAVHTLLSLDAGRIVGDVATPEVDEQMYEYVHRRIPLAAVWEGIRIGHAYFADTYMAACRELVPPDEQPVQLELISRILFQFVNPFSSSVGVTYTQEYDRWIASANAARDEMVRQIVAGERIDPDLARERLNYTIEHRHHAAFVLWQAEPNDERTTALQQVASDLLSALGATNTLLMAVGRTEVWAWGSSPARITDDSIADTALDDHNVGVAMGRILPDLDGFRQSHQQAVRVASTIRSSPLPLGTIHRYDEISLTTLIADDPEWADDFLQHELGPLFGDESYLRDLRETLLSYFESKRSPQAAAARLYVARNTVLYRLRRAEEVLGRPIDARELELWAALRVAAQLPLT